VTGFVNRKIRTWNHVKLGQNTTAFIQPKFRNKANSMFVYGETEAVHAMCKPAEEIALQLSL
jgi:hypothetical protein